MIFFIILIAIALQVFLTYQKVSPFLSLLIVAIATGLLLGMQPTALLTSIEKGVGTTLGGLALIIGLGAILGKLLEAGGAADQITNTLIHRFGEKNVQWAILLTGFLIGIPLYYNAGFIILVPLVFSIARTTKTHLLSLAIPMAASLSVTHCFLPPHPGPVLLVNTFKADMGKTLIYGLILAIPIVILAGPIFGRFLEKIQLSLPSPIESSPTTQHKVLPGKWASFLIALSPVILIALSVVGSHFLQPGFLQTMLVFMGNSTIALLVAVIAAIYFFGLRQRQSMTTVMHWVHEAITGIAVILLIITAGGVFKQVLTDSGTAQYIANLSSQWQLPPLVFGWVVTALLRVMIGSATVAAITAAGIVAPLVTAGAVSPELMVLAVGTGSVFGSHINDTGFWMFKEFFGLSLKQTFLSWTLMETLISILGLVGVLILDAL